MKKFFCAGLLILVSAFSLSLYAQIIPRKWDRVISLDDKEIYLDTSSIKQEKNIISALMITYYNQPKFIKEINKEIVYIKTQTLLDTISRKVNIVGNLYYDKNLKIVGDAFKPLQIVSENNFHLIDTSKTYSTLFEKCIEFLRKQKKENKQGKEYFPLAIKNEFVESKNLDSSIVKTFKPTTELQNEDYDFNSEQLVSKTIFTDGKKFCIQVSSWKENQKAEREVNKLKNMGYQAFMVKVNIPGRGIWYRVRIGYFSSLEEAEEFYNKIKAVIK
ncbi:MAG: SPOR domain-containing protein [Melioribacteraceae bacterium]